MRRRLALRALVSTENLARLLFLGLLLSLLLLLDGYVLILLSRRVGVYLLLAIEASTGLVGVVAVLSSHRNRVRELQMRVREGSYPTAELRRLLTLITAGACLLIPGFATDILGILCLVPPVRSLLGWALEMLFRRSLLELYEYLRIDH
jgi:UPF0716 protein FxsA